MKDVKGACRYCGQTKIIQVPDKFTAGQINDEVTKQCSCDEAVAFQCELEKIEAAEAAKKSAEAMILELFYEEFPSVAAVLKAALPHLAEYCFDKVSIKADDNVTASMSINSKGEIKVERSEKKKYTRVTNY